MNTPESWSAQQLAEFLAGLSVCDSDEIATRTAVERACEALDAEVGAFVRDGEVLESIGFPPAELPAAGIANVVDGSAEQLRVPGLGPCPATAIPVEGDDGATLVLARSMDREFSALDTSLLRAMARVLSLTVQKLRILDAERERRRLLGRLSRIQRSISHHAPLRDVLDKITGGAAELLADELAGLVVSDQNDPDRLVVMGAFGIDDADMKTAGPRPIGEGVAGQAIREGQLVVVEDYQSSENKHPYYARRGLQAMVAAPVREGERVVGALLVGSEQRGRRYSEAEREALSAFADHASLTLTDARLSDQVERALHDPLTGLPNRAFLREHIASREEGPGAESAAIAVDIDSFRGVNDRLGLRAGDEVLIEAGKRIVDVLGTDAVVARVGADEFAALLDEPKSAERKARGVLEALALPFEVAGRELQLSASAGVARCEVGTDQLLRNADLAMYRAKDQGGGCFVTYEQRMHAELVERLELEDDLTAALEGHELEVHFQPKVSLSTSAVIGFEALVRWRHPARGLLPPLEFLAIAESTGQMNELTRRVTELAVEAAKRWSDEGRSLEVAVNLPAASLDPDSGLVEHVRAVLARNELPGQALRFEITEDTLMIDPDRAARTFELLGQLGIAFSIDDFGTGYSSLARLKDLPIDELKIDRSFVTGMCEDRDGERIVQSAIDLARSMDLRVVAEGVETAAEWWRLRAMQCERAQGFFIAKPQTIEAAEDWRRAWERRPPAERPSEDAEVLDLARERAARA